MKRTTLLSAVIAATFVAGCAGESSDGHETEFPQGSAISYAEGPTIYSEVYNLEGDLVHTRTEEGPEGFEPEEMHLDVANMMAYVRSEAAATPYCAFGFYQYRYLENYFVHNCVGTSGSPACTNAWLLMQQFWADYLSCSI